MNQTTTLKLYGHKYSGHCHSIQLYLSLLGIEADWEDVDLLNGAHKEPEFLAKNYLGQVPVLEDGDATIADSNAILVYLALRYDTSGQWYPSDPLPAAEVQRKTDGFTVFIVDLVVPLPGFVKRRAEARIMRTALEDLRRQVETAVTS